MSNEHSPCNHNFHNLQLLQSKSMFLTIPKMFSVIVSQSPRYVFRSSAKHIHTGSSWICQYHGGCKISAPSFAQHLASKALIIIGSGQGEFSNKSQITTVDAMLLCFNVPRWTWNCQLKVTFWSINENNYLSLVSRMTLPRCLSSGLKRLQDYQ